MTEEKNKFIVSSSPHLLTPDSVTKIMWTVVAALAPAALVSIYFFGFFSAYVIALSVVGCVVVEALLAKLFKRPVSIRDGAAVVTGLLLALNLPAGSPWWMILIGCLVTIGLGKMVYGGLGQNVFNPALVGRVFLLISFPVQMTTWRAPKALFSGGPATDALTSATPLGMMKEAILMNKPIMGDKITSWTDMASGYIPGSLGETSAIALILGGLFLLYKGYITWHIPVTYVGCVAVMGQIFHWINPALYPTALFHILAGGLILGALFMATDMVTSPMTGKGQIIFGFGCGVITVIIRLFGGYPEGVSFAILLMNAATPLIDRYTVPKKYGFVPPPKEKEAGGAA